MFRVIIHRRAQKKIERLPRKALQKIYKALEELRKNPYIGKKLHGDFEGLYTLRVWPYRVVYYVRKKKITIYVVDLDHRQGVYK